MDSWEGCYISVILKPSFQNHFYLYGTMVTHHFCNTSEAVRNALLIWCLHRPSRLCWEWLLIIISLIWVGFRNRSGATVQSNWTLEHPCWPLSYTVIQYKVHICVILLYYGSLWIILNFTKTFVIGFVYTCLACIPCERISDKQYFTKLVTNMEYDHGIKF